MLLLLFQLAAVGEQINTALECRPSCMCVGKEEFGAAAASSVEVMRKGGCGAMLGSIYNMNSVLGRCNGLCML